MTGTEPSVRTSRQRPPWLPETQWPFPVRVRHVKGHLIHYVDVGTGPVLLFVHAGMWSFVWRDVLSRLQEDFRCVALDFPGSGLSDARPGFRPTIRTDADVLEDLVRQLDLRDVTFVLHDLGGVIGLDVAARHPDLVRALVLTQAFGWWPAQRTLRAMIRVMGSAPVRALNLATNAVPRATSTSFGVGRRLDAAGRRAFLGPTAERRRRRAFHDLMRDVPRSRSRLDAIEAALRGSLSGRPVLTVFGERNDPAHFQRRWQQLFPAARQVVVPKGHHFPMSDDPQLFAEAVRTWWAEEVAQRGAPGADPVQ